MGISQQIGASSLIRPGVIDNAAARPASPYEGQMVYQKDTDQIFVWNGTSWLYSLTPQTLEAGAWQAWTPAWANVTIGDGTVVAEYCQIQKLVAARAVFTLGSTSAVTNFGVITPPVTAAVGSTYGGDVQFFDTSANKLFEGYFDPSSSTTGIVFGVLRADETFVYGGGLGTTSPFTWTTGDQMFFNFYYEAA